MSEQTKPKYGALVQITALAIALMMYTTSVTTPALSAIATSVGVDYEAIKLVSSLPSLMLVFFSLVGGWLTTKLSIKKCTIIALVCMAVGGLPGIFGGYEVIIASRIFFGAGYGMVFVLASAVITDLFEGQTKDRMMGWKSAAGALAGVVFQTLGGVLVAMNWRYVFLCIFLCIPVLLLVMAFLPDTGVQAAKGPSSGKFTGKLWITVLVGFLLNVFQFAYMQNMTLVILDPTNPMGTALDAANILSMFTALSFVAGLVYFMFSKYVGRFAPAIAVLLVGIGFLVALFAQSVPVFFVASAIFGLGFGFSNPSLTLLAASGVTDPSKTPRAISIYVCATGLGQFLCTYILNFLVGIFGFTGTRAQWNVSAFAITGGAVIGIILLAVLGGKKAGAAAAEA
ncbi:MAG: MFS transporter [Lachnospiraceae bacterium]|jgi:MFS family permease|nr:MFS transporter [Lachnospiraceae bacterium]